MRFNRKFLYIAMLALVFSGCDIDVVDKVDRDKDKSTRFPIYINLSGTVDLDIGGGRRPGDVITMSYNEEGIRDLYWFYPSDGSTESAYIGTGREWKIRSWWFEPFVGQKRIYFAIVPEQGGYYSETGRDYYNNANPSSDFFISNGGVLLAKKSVDINADNRDISNIDLGRIVIDTVRLTGTWQEPTMRNDQFFVGIAFYSDPECTDRVFTPRLDSRSSSGEWQMPAPRLPERTLYVGLTWAVDLGGYGYPTTYKTGVSFSTSAVGPITLGRFDISDEY
ncbi:hypothetical protein ACYULU_10795 [Breznakiellaceae bacterium SP9]